MFYYLALKVIQKYVFTSVKRDFFRFSLIKLSLGALFIAFIWLFICLSQVKAIAESKAITEIEVLKFLYY